MIIVTEPQFNQRVDEMLAAFSDCLLHVGSVTGPGRSGAIAAVYVSHKLAIPFIPYGSNAPVHLGRLLIVDTAMESGATMRKALRKYDAAGPLQLVMYNEPPRVAF